MPPARGHRRVRRCCALLVPLRPCQLPPWRSFVTTRILTCAARLRQVDEGLSRETILGAAGGHSAGCGREVVRARYGRHGNGAVVHPQRAPQRVTTQSASRAHPRRGAFNALSRAPLMARTIAEPRVSAQRLRVATPPGRLGCPPAPRTRRPPQPCVAPARWWPSPGTPRRSLRRPLPARPWLRR